VSLSIFIIGLNGNPIICRSFNWVVAGGSLQGVDNGGFWLALDAILISLE
jgi:hypothetical protein